MCLTLLHVEAHSMTSYSTQDREIMSNLDGGNAINAASIVAGSNAGPLAEQLQMTQSCLRQTEYVSFVLC